MKYNSIAELDESLIVKWNLLVLLADKPKVENNKEKRQFSDRVYVPVHVVVSISLFYQERSANFIHQ